MTERTRSTQRRAVILDTTGGANQDDEGRTNINKIMAQISKHGTVPNVRRHTPLHGDFSFPTDLHEQREAHLAAEEHFMQQPAEVRTAAQNDYIKFIEMLANPDSLALLEQAGVVVDPSGQANDDQTTTPEPGTTNETGQESA